jgi:hypothetical protein
VWWRREGEEAVWECGGALMASGGDGRARGGRERQAAREAARPRGEEEGRWRLKELLTCGSHMSGREREGEEAGERAGAGGPRGPERGWAALKEKEGIGEVGRGGLG